MSSVSIESSNEKQIRRTITQAYDLIEYNFDEYDQYGLTRAQCEFIMDYLFSLYEVDDFLRNKVFKQLKDSESRKKSIYKWEKEDFKLFLIRTCSGCTKRQHRISMDEVIEYIDTNLIKRVENDWAAINQKNKQSFLTKPQAIELLRTLLKDYSITYWQVQDIVDSYLNPLYKYVFFEDYCEILLKINKEFDLQKKSKYSKKQCGCTIF